MSLVTAYALVLAFPLVTNLTLNPYEFWWGLKKGLAPMPAAQKATAERIGRCMLFLVHLIVIAIVFYLIHPYYIREVKSALSFAHWKFNVMVGCGAGLLLIAAAEALSRLLAQANLARTAHYMQRGSPFFWVPLFLLGAFAEEFWRASSLIVLAKTGHSTTVTLLLTTIAFGLGHVQARIVRAFGAATSGLFFAILFLWKGSILLTYSAHVIVNFAGFFRIRNQTGSVLNGDPSLI